MTFRTAITCAAAVSMAALTWAQEAKRPGASPAPPDAAAHKQWMSDAGDLQEDLREALAAQVGGKATEAAGKLEKILSQTERYWAAKRADDVVKIAQRSRELARQVGAWAKVGKFDAAREAFTNLGAACNACHDLHPEKR